MMIFLIILALWIGLGFILAPIVGGVLRRARRSQSVRIPSIRRRAF